MPIPEVSPEHGDAELVSFNARNGRSHILEYLRKESSDIFNRLHSIAEDAAFVEHVHQAYPTIPLLANLRCGAWYSDPSLAANIPAYFKSTDGHFSNWSFNLRRANLHLLPEIVDKNGVILVDSTRAGKRIPDALSKTVPIWCAVINRAVARRFPGDLTSDWDNALYTPPGAVSSQEHHQIESRLDSWAEALVQSSFVLPSLPCPLRPMWITPATTTFPSVPTKGRGFLPVICVSASRQVQDGIERRSVGFSYIQGSGDDHELWSMGLTPRLYWKHKHEILEASRTELPRLISTLVSGKHLTYDGNAPSPITKVNGHILICTTSDFLSRDFICTYDLKNVAFLLLTSQDEILPIFSNETTMLQVHVIGGKKGHMQFLKQVLPRSMDYIRRQLRCGKRVCVVCNAGHDISVGVALSALQKFFDDEGNYVSAELHTADKKSIRTRLEWIISSRPLANPSKTTLKRVNEYFLSPSIT